MDYFRIFVCVTALLLCLVTWGTAVLPLFSAFLMFGDADVSLYFSADPPPLAYKGKVVWITGASSGIGAQLAEDFAVKWGAQVVLSARREEQLEALLERCLEHKPKPQYTPFLLPLDVTDSDAQEVAYNTVIAQFGKIDALVLNAGRAQRMTAIKTPVQTTRDLFDLNFFAPVELAKLALPAMLERNDGGQIVLMSSVSGKLGTPLGSSYSATKWALNGYFDAVRAEIGTTKNVAIQNILPGPVESEITEKAIKDGKGSEDSKKMTTARCTELVAKAMHHRLEESWISEMPVLGYTYLAEYTPWVFRQIIKQMGPKRVDIYENGGDIYSLKDMLFGSDATAKKEL
jgi:dehydrogenase/reductase SDR family protein 7